MEEMKEAGYGMVGSTSRPKEKKHHTESGFQNPVGIVLGGERKKDLPQRWFREAAIPGFRFTRPGRCAALNVSVAAGVVLFLKTVQATCSDNDKVEKSRNNNELGWPSIQISKTSQTAVIPTERGGESLLIFSTH